jgi:hypothetical protein
MSTEKMDSSAVYTLFEELKQKIVELGKKTHQATPTESKADINELTTLLEEVRCLSRQITTTPQSSVIRKEHAFSIDFKNSKAAITMISMGLVILLSLGGNIWQANRNSQLKDNDLKYRYIKMQGAANLERLYGLENIFTYNRDSDSISVIRKRVETYERLVKEQVEKIERARMNAKEAERLQKEVKSVKSK